MVSCWLVNAQGKVILLKEKMDNITQGSQSMCMLINAHTHKHAHRLLACLLCGSAGNIFKQNIIPVKIPEGFLFNKL